MGDVLIKPPLVCRTKIDGSRSRIGQGIQKSMEISQGCGVLLDGKPKRANDGPEDDSYARY
jgi:hypothetical protein